jgi:hypothetical protein
MHTHRPFNARYIYTTCILQGCHESSVPSASQQIRLQEARLEQERKAGAAAGSELDIGCRFCVADAWDIAGDPTFPSLCIFILYTYYVLIIM